MAQSKNIVISVIIPVFNTAETAFKRCIDSILVQTFTNFELILVDDCSTNDSLEICKDYATKDSRIRVIHNRENLGCPQSREVGLKEAKGEYIQFFDSDDWMAENMIEELYRSVIIDNADFAYCDFYRADRDGTVFRQVNLGNIVDTTIAINDIFSRKVCGVVWNKLVKKSLMEKITFPSYFMCEDVVITIQLLYYAQTINYVEKPLIVYTVHPHHTSYRDNVESIKNYMQIIQFLKEKQGDISIFELELSTHININKLWLVNNKYPETRAILRDCYPESNKKLFVRTNLWNLKDGIKLFCAIHHLPLSIILKLYRIHKILLHFIKYNDPNS